MYVTIDIDEDLVCVTKWDADNFREYYQEYELTPLLEKQIERLLELINDKSG